LSASRSYGKGAAILSVGIGVTGLVTYAYFALASHSLPKEEYGGIALLWSTVFIVVSVLYRPVEQLLSRTIADRAVRGQEGNEHLRVAITIQLGLAALFLVVALLLRDKLENDLFNGSETLYWVLVVAVLAYAASYFARGYLAGNRMFGFYGGLVFIEAVARAMFALVVAIGIASGQNVVAFGIAAAPLLSLSVVPWALGRRIRGGAAGADPSGADPGGAYAAGADPATADPVAEAAAIDPDAVGEPEFTLAHGAGFAVAVLVIMLCEQTIYNAGPLLIKATESPAAEATALAGFAFNVLLIARAPLQLFQAVQTSILPHLTTLRASGDVDPFRRSVNLTLAAIALFAGAVAVAMAVIGPTIMKLAFGGNFHYQRIGLVMIAVGMGFYLSAATLNQAALAHARARQAAVAWVFTAVLFVVFLLLPGFDNRVLQLETGYLAAAGLLCALLYGLYRRSLQAQRPSTSSNLPSE
jgi:O-antigen/teichoic acid export membrane protein